MQSRMDYLLYHKKSRPSGMLIQSQLPLQRIKLSKTTGKPLSPATMIRTLIRWGSTMDLPQGFQPEFTINPPSNILVAGDKLQTLTQLKQAGILVPTFSRTISELIFPLLGRSRHGSQGKDIVVYEDSTQIKRTQNHDFYSQYIPNTREYRIHVVRGKIIRIQGKYLDFPDEQGSGFIKNHSHGYRFRTPDKELNNDRKEAAIESVKALGLDFGAVDLIIGTDKKVYVLEVNTAPAMSPMTMGCYVDAFRTILEENKSRSVYPVSNGLSSVPVSSQERRTAPVRRSTTPSTSRSSGSLRKPVKVVIPHPSQLRGSTNNNVQRGLRPRPSKNASRARRFDPYK